MLWEQQWEKHTQHTVCLALDFVLFTGFPVIQRLVIQFLCTDEAYCYFLYVLISVLILIIDHGLNFQSASLQLSTIINKGSISHNSKFTNKYCDLRIKYMVI